MITSAQGAVSAPPAPPVETEAKLRASRRAFRALETIEVIDGWHVVARRAVRLRDTYWDTPDRRLGAAGRTLRIREMDGRQDAELTLKGAVTYSDPSRVTGSRTELTVAAPAGSRPEDWARLPAAQPVFDALSQLGIEGGGDAGDRGGTRPSQDADIHGGSDSSRHAGRGVLGGGHYGGLRPDVVLINPRRELVLRRRWPRMDGSGRPDGPGGPRGREGPGGQDEGAEAVLSLDEMRIEGQPYCRRYVEIELKRGSAAALDELAQAVIRRFGLRPARRGKVQAAREWLARREGKKPPMNADERR